MRDEVRDVHDVRSAAHPLTANEGGWLTPCIQKAHERSESFGLVASARPDYDVLTGAELTLKLEQNRVLTAHALPVMETLHEQIVNTQSMIVLTDAEGLILHSIGDDDFLRRAEKVALRPGANWAEDRQGTNAIGTALAERNATVVHGDQHYLAANRFLTCSSVPILDPYGDVAGVLDVTGDYRSYHQHTMALAKMSVQMIENHLFASKFRDTLRIAFHSRPEFLGTLMEGIAAFTFDGRFLSANRSAQFQLGLSLAALRAHTLGSLFGVTSAQLVERARGQADQVVPLNLHNGAVVCAHVALRRPSLSQQERDDARPEARSTVSSARAEPRAAAQPSAAPVTLAQLDTGDAQVAAVITKVRKVIGKDIPILITGETGTGKELLAQAIHNDSPRRDAPFVAVNCASIPETLIESELFGYEEGAFTGARRKGALGKLLQANGGTLFLDEIGDMPYPLQVRLLRVLQERVVNPLGSTKSIPVDIAVVCATHRSLREMIAQNRFREDLYYRLNGLVVKLPPLRERTDLAVVIARMLERESLSGAGDKPLAVAPEVMALFSQCTWPGNFRQLGNLLRTAAAMVEADGEIRREHLPDDFFEDLPATAGSYAAAAPAAYEPTAVTASAQGTRLHDVAISVIAATVAQHGGNVSAAARALGVSRTTIYRKLPATMGMTRASNDE
ncbi:sigma-54-dependent Fis family transcriptional regulator [Trinickia caryophylli]|uniref:GAF modulated sigma54 specific transcriptional regulator, Fis family n=1 Tax=Trinickia caryophylli TaxID=28094 RepID=A0A1X7CH29_TRICW|nr:sigma-54-dependent Fis family transcriptional regulator [Trinickia caryophylli]PMS11645.1 sigma-54-dependent Fis family transcriptional regulator [Trinickia caryophylli]TRX19868.1 sigma-54-dependent Fis family transcriptional regulator [Trinickia caryophylli]WQE12798.1 sigma-54-dependent Fis family transcriptional regulator [Trinickia caryophylli]SME96315.1 GAF modulated sigma54 specific transcriptional regulator, Fis family [Trinickia caryophylli]GLU30514.1 sigma-54-dependent Fis family tr